MEHINEEQLESDLAYRFGYVSQFMGFGEADIEAIHGAAEALGPLVPAIVDAVYDKLFSYDCTKRHFVPRQHGYEGETPESLESLTLDHEIIQFRKKHLGGYLVKLVTATYDISLVKYLDMVGKMHTPHAGSKELIVPLVQMNALMGFVADALINIIMGLGLNREVEIATVRAFSKLLWIQNDLITRHYQA